MSRFVTSLMSTTGLLLVTILANVPTKLQAETNSQKSPAILPPAIVKPSTGTSIATPAQSVTNNSTPTPSQIPTAKPGSVSATSQPPATDAVNLILRLNEKKVYVYKGDKVIAKYPVAIGKKGWETPTGDWYVMEKVTNPGWTSFKNGQVIKPGPNNPLGERWIGFWTDGKDVIGFHGTPSVKSIGTAASHGCVRMFNKDVKALFPLVKVGTVVKVVNE